MVRTAHVQCSRPGDPAGHPRTRTSRCGKTMRRFATKKAALGAAPSSCPDYNNLRRINPAPVSKPVPSNAREAGSGTAVARTSALLLT